VVFDSEGDTLVSGSYDTTVKVWNVKTGKLIRTVEVSEPVASIALDSKDGTLAAGCTNIIALFKSSGERLRTLGDTDHVWALAFHPLGRTLASGSNDNTVKLWDTKTGELLQTLEGHANQVLTIAFEPLGSSIASAGSDKSIKVWDAATGKLHRTLERHTDIVDKIAYSPDGQLLASKDTGGTCFLWSSKTWKTLATFTHAETVGRWVPGLTFHPTLPRLAIVNSELPGEESDQFKIISILELDVPLLLNRGTKVIGTEALHHTTAKIVLVGDSGVGKTGLGWRMAHGEFREHSSTHGQQFWVLNQLGTRRADGTECEAILWDLAGQPDYRLTHALFLDDADLALVLFDPTDSRDPLHGVEFWLKQLRAGHAKSPVSKGSCQIVLVGARTDRGEARLTADDLAAFCQHREILGGYLPTNAKENIGLEELLGCMKDQIAWDSKPATVTTVTFKRIKDYVLELKENPRRRKVIVSVQDLRKRLEKINKRWKFTDSEMMTAIRHLGNYGYVRVLRTSKGEERILLSPELLNNLAASFVLEARRNQDGLGSLEEKRLLSGEYKFRELDNLSKEEQEVLLDSAALLFLEHNICFRETDLGGRSYLVYPELMNLNKPVLADEQKTEDGMSYTISGAVENIYASLVVLLGYTQTFTRRNQWRSQARYEVGDGLICGFRQDEQRDGGLDLVLYFGANVGRPVRTLFQGLFESFLARRNLSVLRYEPVVCSKGHAVNRTVVREEARSGSGTVFCSKCGEKLALPKADEPIQLTQIERHKIEEQQWIATRRSLFEQAVFQLTSYVENRKLKRPECFVSYVWGNADQERWVERTLATDLQKAGITVVLDRWENARVGASISRFIERIEKVDKVIVVGTELYRKKYDNKDPTAGYVVAAEVDLISNRLMGTEEEKETVLPLLLSGLKASSSLPPLLHGRIYADFRTPRAYFIAAFNLILDIYGISHGDPAVADLREALKNVNVR
jgi:GTPase SAR1 family protein